MHTNSDLSSFITACQVVKSASKKDIKFGKLVYLQRTTGTTWIVERGYVRLGFIDSTGRSLTRQLLGRGAIFGDLPFSNVDSVENEQAFSSGACRLLKVSREELEREAARSHEFQSAMLIAFSAQLQAANRRLQWQLISPLRARIATTIYDLVRSCGSRCGHGHLVDIRLTHEEFSDLVVAARPVVSKILGELKHDGVIDYTRAHICVIDLERLLEVSKNESS